MFAIAQLADVASAIPSGIGSFVPHPPLIPTANKATECLLIGFNLFFSEKSTLPVYDLMHSDQGFKATILRRLMQILFQELGLDTLTVPDPLAMANITKNLVNSKFINMMNIILLMGDHTITSARKMSINLDDYIGQVADMINSKRDDLDLPANLNLPETKINPASLISRTKLSPTSQDWLYKTKTSWAMGSTPSLYILPSTIKKAEARLTGNNNYLNNLASKKYVKSTETNRLTRDQSKAIEQVLDASYVPFYFHDLRTNEIISFHAFLKTLEDSFQANYQSDVVYGRADPVHIYKNTERTIGLSFIVAAVNESDFDQMWYKINKFITMVYPQYTAGRQLSFENKNFYQPFSQVPAASPMIRMRVGDLVKSNYSTFGMGRLFGLAQLQGLGTNSATSETPQQQQTTAEQITPQVRQRMERGDYAVGEKFSLTLNGGRQDSISVQQGGSFDCGPSKFAEAAGRRVEASEIAATISQQPNGLIVEVVGDLSDENYKRYSLRAEQPPDLQSTPGSRSDFSFDIWIQKNTSAPVKWQPAVIDSEVIRVANLLANPTPPPTTGNATQDFLSTANNPIMRAFETTRGDGMAGFISNIAMDWMMDDGLWETSGYGNRAPTMCKITIQFKPIFDLPPGLDSNGFMNAPVYPVGNSSNAMIIDTETENTTQDKINSFNSYKARSARNISVPTTEPTTGNNISIPGIGRSGIPSFRGVAGWARRFGVE